MTTEDLTLPDGFEAPNCTGVKYENWKLKKENDRIVLRILPAMRSLIQKGDFGAFWGLHFGWNGRNQTDPTKFTYRPFLCVESKRNGMIEKECKACKYIVSHAKKWEVVLADIKKQQEDLKTRGVTAGKTEAEINKALQKLTEKLIKENQPLKEWLNAHSCNKKFRIPCMNKQGQFGIFAVPYGLVKKLREVMKELTTRVYPGTQFAIQPAGRKGVWFEFIRNGKASATSDTVVPVRVQNNDGSEMLDFHTITNEQLDAAKKCLPDLIELMELSRVSDDQMEALIKLDRDGGGSSDPDEVDAILGNPNLKEAKSDEDDMPDWTNIKTNTSTVKNVVQNEPASQPVTETKQETKTETVAQPKTETKGETKVAQQAEVKTEPKAEPKAEAKRVVTDEDFDSLFA
jgi:hypothetical protein